MTMAIEYPFWSRNDFVSDTMDHTDILLREIVWEQRDTARMEYWTNVYDLPYTYGSGRGVRTYESKQTHPIIDDIGAMLLDEYDVVFEGCFLNAYMNEGNFVGWHSDDSPEIDQNKPIAVISFGAEREIWFRKIGDKGVVPNDHRVSMPNGSLVMMDPGMQHTHQHRIPQHSKPCGLHVSLTYRGLNRP